MTVRNQQQGLLQNATVSLQGTSESAVTDSTGQAVLTLTGNVNEEESFVVSVAADNYASANQSHVFTSQNV